MAKKAKKIKTSKGVRLKVVNPDAAGIDIADGEIQVCVPEDRDGENNRRFGSFTCDLRLICDWLKACGITTVAMEATGVYFVQLYMRLREAGIEVVLANPLQVKNLMDDKTDAADAEWLMLLHSYGLVKPSFQPENVTRQIRNLTRHRQNLIRTAGTEVQRMQKSMELMNIKLSTVISDVLGKSGQAIIRAILGGNHDPKSLSELADGRCKASKDTIAKSLEGTWDEDILFMLRQSVDLYDYLQKQIEACDRELEKLLKTCVAQIDGQNAKLVRTKKRASQKNAVTIDMEHFAFAAWGVNVMAMPGISTNSMLELLAELGPDFAEKFDTCDKFCRWCNLAPGNKISGGKVLSSHLPKRWNPVGQVFRNSANTIRAEKSELGAFYRRMKSRSGAMQAVVATAHKMARIFYTMVKNKTEYDATKVGADEKSLLEKKIARANYQLQKLNERLKKIV